VSGRANCSTRTRCFFPLLSRVPCSMTTSTLGSNCCGIRFVPGVYTGRYACSSAVPHSITSVGNTRLRHIHYTPFNGPRSTSLMAYVGCHYTTRQTISTLRIILALRRCFAGYRTRKYREAHPGRHTFGNMCYPLAIVTAARTYELPSAGNGSAVFTVSVRQIIAGMATCSFVRAPTTRNAFSRITVEHSRRQLPGPARTSCPVRKQQAFSGGSSIPSTDVY